MSPSRPVMAIYGGTFDPFHNGHASICEAVLKYPQVHQLRLIPCFIPALKAAPRVASSHRVAMLQSWRDTQTESDRIIIDNRELTRGGPSYTVDTIESLAKQYSDYNLVFVLGADAWNSLARWHRVNDLIKKVAFWVFQRADENRAVVNSALHQASTPEQGLSQGSEYFWFDNSVDQPVSSSAIRQSVQQSDQQLPPVVAQYIRQHQLYR